MKRVVVLAWLLSLATATANATESICYGGIANGRLSAGVRLPMHGDNFTVYSYAGHVLGRTFVHSKVREVVLSAYARLQQHSPDKQFVYGETGWRAGGRFKPHRTHQNGLSVDFMVPVVNDSGHSVALPSHALNKWGYAIEFDARGRWQDLRIDFEALAEHVYQLRRSAQERGIDIERVIFDPALQPRLWRTARGQYLRKQVRFSKKRVWVRHDEHYHVDFRVGCKPL